MPLGAVKSQPQFYICTVCGNLIEQINDSGLPMSCCGRTMRKLVAGESDGAAEKHVPVYAMKGNEITVCVGSSPHPMEDWHYIEWIEVETNLGVHRVHFKPGDKPEATISLLKHEQPKRVFAYCNLHGLWQV